MTVNKRQLDAFTSLSDHLTNNREDYYEIPESKIQELARVYNKNRMVVLSWDDNHNMFDINTFNSDIDKKVLERILKLSKIHKKDEDVH